MLACYASAQRQIVVHRVRANRTYEIEERACKLPPKLRNGNLIKTRVDSYRAGVGICELSLSVEQIAG